MPPTNPKSMNAKTTGDATLFKKIDFFLRPHSIIPPSVSPTPPPHHPTPPHPSSIQSIAAGETPQNSFEFTPQRRRENVPTSNYSRSPAIHFCQQKRNPKDFPGIPSFDPAMASGTFKHPVTKGILHRADSKNFATRGKQEWSNTRHIRTPTKN